MDSNDAACNNSRVLYETASGTPNGNTAMKVILFWLAIVFTSLVPSYILASDNPHIETCGS